MQKCIPDSTQDARFAQGNTHLISTGKYKLAVQLLGVQPRVSAVR